MGEQGGTKLGALGAFERAGPLTLQRKETREQRRKKDEGREKGDKGKILFSRKGLLQKFKGLLFQCSSLLFLLCFFDQFSLSGDGGRDYFAFQGPA